MDRNTVHLYETLGVPKSSTQEEIKKAYRYVFYTSTLAITLWWLASNLVKRERKSFADLGCSFT